MIDDGEGKPQREIRFLIGASAVGKSTYTNSLEHDFQGTIIGMDRIIEKLRAEREARLNITVTFDDAVRHHLPEAKEIFDRQLKEAVARGDNILLDMINDRRSDRQYRVAIAKASKDYDYHAVAVVIHPPEEGEHIRRLVNRAFATGRFNAVNNSELRPIDPIEAGEFDEIRYVGVAPEKPMDMEYRNLKTIELADLAKDILTR